MSMTKILAISGSLRSASHNRQLLEVAAENAPEGVTIEIATSELIASIPHYNEDIDGDNAPAAAQQIRQAITEADAILIASPVYNHDLPSAPKNVIDWASRPQGDGVIKDKPVAFIGTAYGPSGGSYAHDHGLTAVEIAGGKPVRTVSVAIPGSVVTFAETHPREHADVVEQIKAAVAELVANI